MIILDDLDFDWEEEKVNQVIGLWKKGKGSEEISNAVNRSEDETFMLLLHLTRHGKIKKRGYGIWGKVKNNGIIS